MLGKTKPMDRAILRRPVTVLIALAAGAGPALVPQAALAAPSRPGSVGVVASGPIVAGDSKSPKCVADARNSRANDTAVTIWDCRSSAAQTWAIESDGTIRVHGKCLDIFQQGRHNHTQVELWTCTGKNNQRWWQDNGTLVNPAAGKCLDDPGYNTADGTQLIIYTCNGGANQQWVVPQAG
jgi:Ricin-type beta-trefoil lectin domain